MTIGVDKVSGKPIKSNISGFEVDPCLNRLRKASDDATVRYDWSISRLVGMPASTVDTWTANNEVLSAQDEYRIAYWRAEDLTDSIGSYDLTNNGSTPIINAWNNKGFDFNGGQWLSHTADLVGGANTILASCWVKFDVLGIDQTILYQSNNGATGKWALGLTTSNTLVMSMKDSPESTSWHTKFSTNTFSLGVWYNIVAFWDTVNDVFYARVNNVEWVNSAEVVGPISTASSTYGFGIGRLGHAAANHVRGIGDEFGLWRNLSLSETEFNTFATALYNDGDGAYPVPDNAFTLDNLTSLNLWLDVSQETYNDNDTVGSLTDRSGNGRNATQTTEANKPIYKTNIFGNNPGILFDGSNDIMPIAYNANKAQAHMFAVYKSVSYATDQAVYGCNSTADGWHWSLWSNGKASCYLYTNVSIGGSSQNLTQTANNPYIGEIEYNGSAITMRLNGATDGTGTASGYIKASSTTMLGNNHTPSSRFFNGYMAEIIDFAEPLSDRNRKQVEEYLADKWSITLS